MKKHEPSDTTREMVLGMVRVGVNQEYIAKALGIHHNTLRKHYKEELDTGKITANAEICNALFKSALDGNTAAQIFWMKTQAGWRETNRIEHGIDDGTIKPTVIQLIPHQEDAETDGED